jgi:tRNA(fMet)-specific endonuclease VapC
VFLDTSFQADLLRERNCKEDGPAVRKIRSLVETNVMISVFTLCELRAGAELSDNPNVELDRVAQLVEPLPLVYPDSSFPVLYGEILADLTRAGTPIPLVDLLLAVLAKRSAVPILTRDARHFRKIPGLEVATY